MRLHKPVLRLMPLLLLSSIMSGTLSLSGCAHIPIPVTVHDEDLYFLKQASEEEWAVLMHFLSAGQEQVSKAAWDSKSQGKVCMELKAFDDFNTEIGKLCSQVTCNYELMNALSNLVLRLHFHALALK